MTVKTVKKNFMDAFGGSLRVLKDGKPADEGATMASLKAEGCKGGELELKGNTKVAGMKKKVADLYGISVVVYAADGKKPVDDGLTLASIGAPQTVTPTEKTAEKKEQKEKPAKEPKEKPAQKAAPVQSTAAGFSFNELLAAALADGVLTDKERAILIKKATTQGLDPDEVEMIIEGRLAKKMRMQPKVEKKNEEKKKTYSSDTNNSISDHNKEQLERIKAITGAQQTQPKVEKKKEGKAKIYSSDTNNSISDHNREQLERIKAITGNQGKINGHNREQLAKLKSPQDNKKEQKHEPSANDWMTDPMGTLRKLQKENPIFKSISFNTSVSKNSGAAHKFKTASNGKIFCPKCGCFENYGSESCNEHGHSFTIQRDRVFCTKCGREHYRKGEPLPDFYKCSDGGHKFKVFPDGKIKCSLCGQDATTIEKYPTLYRHDK